MAQQTINIGSAPNDGTGDPLRTAFDKVNSNFTELYNDDAGDVNSIIAGDGISVDTATGNVTVTNTITNNNQLINGAGYVDGSGTTNRLPKFTDADTIGNSTITDDGTNVSITGDFTADAIYLNDMTLGSGALYYGTDRLTLANYNPTGSVYIETGGGTAAMVLDENQNVGIGTSSPTYKLDVNGTIRATDRVWLSSIDALSIADTDLRMGYTNSNILFRTNSGERMRIDASGNVQIGAGTRFGKFDILNVGGSGYNFIVGAAANGDNYYTSGTSGAQVFRAGASERMRIDSSGNVGIGTSSPSDKLDVNGRIQANRNYIFGQDNYHIKLNEDTIPSYLGNVNGGFYIANGSYYGSQQYNIDSTQTGLASIFGQSDGDILFLNSSFTSGSTLQQANERMRLKTNGDLHVDGDVIAYSTTISDQRLKDDIQTIDNALDKVSNLRGVSYTWNNGNRKGQKDLGLIAQEVEQVLPELVREKEMPMIDGGTYKTVDYEKIVGVLIEAVKELKAEVEILKSK